MVTSGDPQARGCRGEGERGLVGGREVRAGVRAGRGGKGSGNQKEGGERGAAAPRGRWVGACPPGSLAAPTPRCLPPGPGRAGSRGQLGGAARAGGVGGVGPAPRARRVGPRAARRAQAQARRAERPGTREPAPRERCPPGPGRASRSPRGWLRGPAAPPPRPGPARGPGAARTRPPRLRPPLLARRLPPGHLPGDRRPPPSSAPRRGARGGGGCATRYVPTSPRPRQHLERERRPPARRALGTGGHIPARTAAPPQPPAARGPDGAGARRVAGPRPGHAAGARGAQAGPGRAGPGWAGDARGDLPANPGPSCPRLSPEPQAGCASLLPPDACPSRGLRPGGLRGPRTSPSARGPDLAAPAAGAPTARRPAAPGLALALTPAQTFHSACWDGGEGGLGKPGRNSSKGTQVVPNIQKEVPPRGTAWLKVGAKPFLGGGGGGGGALGDVQQVRGLEKFVRLGNGLRHTNNPGRRPRGGSLCGAGGGDGGRGAVAAAAAPAPAPAPGGEGRGTVRGQEPRGSNARGAAPRTGARAPGDAQQRGSGGASPAGAERARGPRRPGGVRAPRAPGPRRPRGVRLQAAARGRGPLGPGAPPAGSRGGPHCPAARGSGLLERTAPPPSRVARGRAREPVPRPRVSSPPLPRGRRQGERRAGTPPPGPASGPASPLRRRALALRPLSSPRSAPRLSAQPRS
uniref:collagen alpha-1(I) chain-like n=1 Tax=Nyctereutes procyonoides TaxID=34880 RepID=UPI0024439117|nr:collagen alpha-1(I) chain-like [Nyctereutes procyonoides]